MSIGFWQSGVVIMKKLVVFVSSVIKETQEEREAVHKAIRSLGLAEAFIFELATASTEDVESYCVKKVEECDIFVQILSKTLSKPVQLEYSAAKIHEKPRLEFVKRNSDRSQEIEDFVSLIGIKYKRFASLEELEEQIREAVIDTIINKYRSEVSRFSLEKIETEREKVISTEIVDDFFNSTFIPLKRHAIKSPSELVKENPQEDDVLPIMSEMAQKDSIPDRIKLALEQNYAQKYAGSWAEKELEIIGLKLIKEKLVKRISQFADMYDAGCANCGQYHALKAQKIFKEPKISLTSDFRYVGQDFNPDWKAKFDTNIGEFVNLPLPLVSDTKGTFSLLCCTHALHYFSSHPIAIYSSLFSFNRLLKKDGYCYITTPEKESQPGMLDLLEKAAIDAGFRIIDRGKERLVQNKENRNITTFLYLILQKEKDFEEENKTKDDLNWKKLIGVSFFREKHKEYFERFGVTREGDIPEKIRYLERDLEIILNEGNPYLRTFRYALDAVNKKLSRRVQLPPREDCIKDIESSIRKIDEIVNKNQIDFKELQCSCGIYFYNLVQWYVINYNMSNLNEIDFGIYNVVKSVLSGSKDIRVHINDLNGEQIARLLKHLFELCDYENINIREAFEDYVKTN